MSISDLLYTDSIWFIGGIVLLASYFWLRKKFPHHAIFSLNYQNPLRTFIIPLIVTFIVLSAFRFFSGIPLIETRVTNWFAIISYIITGPFFEELFLRGLILGGSFYLASKIESKIASNFFIGIGFIIQLSIFIFIHGYTDWTRILYLGIIGLMYSLLFIFNKKDVLPSMISHALTNLMIIAGIFS